jgi:hypothetical protein
MELCRCPTTEEVSKLGETMKPSIWFLVGTAIFYGAADGATSSRIRRRLAPSDVSHFPSKVNVMLYYV